MAIDQWPKTADSLPTTRRSASLQLIGLNKQFGNVTAIENVTLDVEAGEFVTLLGASGSGKTTTLMAVAGFVQPSGGRILINGVDQTAMPPYRRDIGIVFQHFALFPHLTVEKNVAFPLTLRKLAKAEIATRVRKILELVRLAGFSTRQPAELSGGQQQRVALARALVYEPSILLLDEPLGALDKNLREEMQFEIRRIQQALGITTISVTHDQQEAIAMSDRIAVMRSGRIEQIGAPADIYERPANRFVATFMGVSNFLRVRIVDGKSVMFQGQRGCNGSSSLPLQIARRTGLPDTGEIDLVIRPERLRVVRDDGVAVPSGDSFGLSACVKAITYAGDVWHVTLALDEHKTLVAAPMNFGEPDFRVGDPVRLEWQGDQVWAVPIDPNEE